MVRKTVAGLVAGFVALTTWVAPATANAAANDLIISEYVEGSSFNKAIELYNGTDAAIDLGQYRLELFSNGSSNLTTGVNLTGTLAPGATYVVAHPQAVLGGHAPDLRNMVANWNGDDAIILLKDSNVVDSFGQKGARYDFGTDVTLIRDANVTAGDTNPTDAFDNTVEWTLHPKDTFTGLGSHTMDDMSTGPTDPEPVDSCEADATAIGAVQGEGDATLLNGQTITVQGTVVGVFQEGGFNGYYLQDEGDGNAATSDGIFIYDRGRIAGDINEGDVLRVTGTAGEYYTLTQITATEVKHCGTAELPEPTVIDFPNTEFEQYESMLVTFDAPLSILEVYQYGRYGQIAVGPERQMTPTAVHDPGSAEARALDEYNDINRVLIDDGRGNQNPTPAIHPATLEPLTMDTLFRLGDEISGVAGVLDYRFGNWAIQPTQPGTIANVNERPAVPEVGGDLQVASFNVLNYFTTLGSRGAETPAEFERQEAKIVAALNEVDAQIVALNEIENNGTAVEVLVDALNEAAGHKKWAALNTGVIGTDQITTAFIYQPKFVEPVGEWDILTSADDPRFDDTKNRPTLAQTFRHLESNRLITVAANHLKSKGSACGDPSEATMNYLVGNCNETRKAAAQAMVEWLEGDSIGVTKTENIMILGDLNSYDHEDPIKVFEAAGYTDLSKKYQGENAYSYVFDGQLGYLDYALANEAMTAKVVGADEWHINADELPLIDYTMKYKQPYEDALYAPDAYRSSDHDPVIVGIQFGGGEIGDVVARGVANSYIEVTNTSDYPMDLSGWMLNDSKGRTGTYTFDEGIVLAPGESIRIPVRDLGFTLQGNETLTLADADGSQLFSFQWRGKSETNGNQGKGKANGHARGNGPKR